jgi:RHS repeat-associated protein
MIHPIGGAGYNDLPLGGVSFTAGAGQMATTTWRYDQAGRPTTITNPLGQVTTLSYNSRGDLLQETHPDRGITQFRYDRWGRLRLRRDANDAANASHPNPQVTCSGGNCLRFQYLKYDRLGRPTEEGTLFTTVPGHFSDPAFRDDPAFPGAGLAYQAHIQHSYGSAAGLGRGLPATVAVHQDHSFTPAGAVFSPTATDLSTYLYDVNGRVVRQIRTLHGLAGQHELRSTYNRQGLATETRYRSPLHQKDYWRRTTHDDLGRPVAHYSGHDDLVLQQSQSQLDSRYGYDAVGRLYRRHIAATGNAAQPYRVQEELHHDIRGRVTAQRSDLLDITLSYDPRGNIQSQRWQNRHFDADPARWNQYTYHYDPDYRLVAADYGQVREVCGAASTERQAGLPADPFVQDGQAIYLSAQDQPEPPYDENATHDRNTQQDALSYAEDPALLEDLIARLGAPALDGFTPVHQLDGTDHLASIIDAEGRWRSADEIDLSAAVGEPCFAVLEPSDRYDTWYRYDAAGNLSRLKRRQTHPTTGAWALSTLDYSYTPGMPHNRLDKVGGAGALYSSKYTYDPNGNMVSDQATGLSAVRHDWRNRPLEMADTGAVHRYRYDAAGQRSYRELQVGATVTRREFHLDGLVLDANGSLLRMELAEGYAELLPGGGLARRYVLRDWLGSPRVTLDPAGAVVQARDTDPYGRPLDLRSYAQGQEAGREGFTGHERDLETGYDYHGARYYQAEIGRYLGVDVMAAARSWLSSYQYTQDNPVNRVDLTGQLDGDYYAIDGTHLGSDGINDDKAYLVHGVSRFSIQDFQSGGKYFNNHGGFQERGDGFRVSELRMSNSELNTRAFMGTIKQTENAGNAPLDYNVTHGKREKGRWIVPEFSQNSCEDCPSDYADHPYRGTENNTAAGAYQILRPTFLLYKAAFPEDIVDFSPRSQDLLVLHIFEESGAFESIKKGDLRQAANILTLPPIQFSSLPANGQGGNLNFDQLRQLYKSNLSIELQGKSNLAIPQGSLFR